MVALYADRTVIPDPFTHVFAFHHSHAPIYMIDLLRVLEVLTPFIRAGLLELGPPLENQGALPADVKIAFMDTANELTEAYSSDLCGSIEEVEGDQVVFVKGLPIPDCEDVPMGRPVSVLDTTEGLERLTAEFRAVGDLPVIRNAAAQEVARVMRGITQEMLFAASAHATTTVGARPDIQFLTRFQESGGRYGIDQDLAQVSALSLPWVADLQPTELLELRDRAGRALPAFRALLASHLSNGLSGQEIVRELRAQAEEVDAEICAIEKQHDKLYRFGIEALAISFFGYALSTAQPGVIGASLAAIVAALAHVQSTLRDSESKRAKLITNPAVVLMESQRLLDERTA